MKRGESPAFDHLEKEKRRKRQRTIYVHIQSTVERTTVNETSELLPVQHYIHLDTGWSSYGLSRTFTQCLEPE